MFSLPSPLTVLHKKKGPQNNHFFAQSHHFLLWQVLWRKSLSIVATFGKITFIPSNFSLSKAPRKAARTWASIYSRYESFMCWKVSRAAADTNGYQTQQSIRQRISVDHGSSKTVYEGWSWLVKDSDVIQAVQPSKWQVKKQRSAIVQFLGIKKPKVSFFTFMHNWLVALYKCKHEHTTSNNMKKLIFNPTRDSNLNQIWFRSTTLRLAWTLLHMHSHYELFEFQVQYL